MKIITLAILIGYSLIVFSLGQEADESDLTENPLKTVSEAYESKDIEKIKEYCLNPSLRSRLVVILANDPSSPWKEEATLALLEAPWPSDREIGKPTPPGVPPPLLAFQVSVELLAPILPGENLKINDEDTYEKLSNLEGRRLLVRKFREARSERGVGSNVGHLNPHKNGSLIDKDESIENEDGVTPFPEGVRNSDQAKSHSRRILFALCVFAVLIFGAITFFVCAKKWRSET